MPETKPGPKEPEEPRPPKVSVVVVSCNRVDLLRSCLAALEKSESREAMEILVVDNGSTDGSAQLESDFPATRFIRIPRNFGLTKAMNLGLRAASGDYILFLHEDTELSPETVRELAAHQAVSVHLSINSLDSELARKLEPRAASPRMRLAAVEALAKAGVPAGVLVAPVIPALNDHEIPSVLAAAKAAGAGWAGTEILRLPLTVAPIFEQWLDQNVPGRKEKVLNRIRAIRGGKLNDPRFGARMRGQGIFADQISQMFHVARRKAGLPEDGLELSTAAFRRPEGDQLRLGL